MLQMRGAPPWSTGNMKRPRAAREVQRMGNIMTGTAGGASGTGARRLRSPRSWTWRVDRNVRFITGRNEMTMDVVQSLEAKARLIDDELTPEEWARLAAMRPEEIGGALSPALRA